MDQIILHGELAHKVVQVDWKCWVQLAFALFNRGGIIWLNHFCRHRVSRPRRMLMGVRIVLADKEPIGLALGRFKKQIEQSGADLRLRPVVFIKATEVRRAKRFKKKFKARLATLLAQRAGEQPAVPAFQASFWRRTGKP
jgi:hypothetical protein